MPNKADISEILIAVQEASRKGDGKTAARLLAKINVAKTGRSTRLELAAAARRAGLFSYGLRLLSPLVDRSRSKWRDPASPAERAEYAVNLQKAGGVNEALEILMAVDPAHAPEARLFRAFCHFVKWDYAAAVPELESYLRLDLPEYTRLIGQVNLASAFVMLERGPEALKLIGEISASAASGGHHRLLANCRELRSQVLIQNGELKLARGELEQADRALANDATHDRLFVRKWFAVLEALETGNSAPLLAFRNEALARRHWESVREADLYRLKVDFDEMRFRRLYVGTPFAGYKQRILRSLGVQAPTGSFILGHGGRPCLDIRSGQFAGGGNLNRGGKIHLLISVLLKDLYRPLKLAGLFGELFPGEYFNVDSSPDRVHQILRRARRWADSEGFGSFITEDQGDFSFSGNADFSVKIYSGEIQIDKNQLALRRLTEWAKGCPFTAADARAALGMSSSAFGRFSIWAVENSALLKLGSGSRTTYVLPENKSRAA